MGTDPTPQGTTGGPDGKGAAPEPNGSPPGGVQPEAQAVADGNGSESNDLRQTQSDLAKWRRLANERDAELKRIKEATASEADKAVTAARREGFTEAETKYRKMLFEAEVTVAASGLLADPNDAVKLLDLDAIDVDADGRPVAKSVKAAIADLVKAKSYLAAKPTPGNGNGFGGGADQGARAVPVASADGWLRGLANRQTRR